ncbi:tetratricopeptide repeat protein [Bacteroidota bacterium]
MRKILLITLITFVLQLATVFAQEKNTIDSLKQVIATAKQDTNKIKTLLQLGDQYLYTPFDSSLFYFKKALAIAESIEEVKYIAECLKNIGIFYTFSYLSDYEKALENYRESLIIYEELGDKDGIAYNLLCIGIIYHYQDSYDKAIEYYQKSLVIYEEINDEDKIAYIANNTGLIYFVQSDYSKALEYYHKALKICEKIGDKEDIAKNLEQIGVVYSIQINNNKALEYYQKSLEINKEINNIKGQAGNLENIGIVYSDQGDYKKALEYYYKALKINKEIYNEFEVSSNLTNIAAVYLYQKKYSKAIEYFEEVLRVNEKNEDKYTVCLVLGNLASIYNNLKEYNKSITFAKKSLDMAKSLEALDLEKEAYNHLSDAYKGLNNFKKSLEYKDLYILINDSVFNNEKTKAIAEMNTLYETEKKEKQIIQQQAELKTSQLQTEKEKAEKEKQQTQRNMFIVAFGLMIILAVFVFRSYRQKNKANILLAEQKQEIAEANEELNQQNEEITAQRDQIEEQRDTVIMQKEKIEEIHNEISESINYATRLQGAILPESQSLDNYLSEYFVLFKPKDKVSGDFYWWSHIENHTIITAADCTGHGVPGAFMSMLGISFLREIVQKEYITHTGIILRKLRKEIIKSLKQKGETGEQKDGMDMAIVSINHETNMVQFSGANNPLYVLTKRKLKDLEPLKDFESFYEIKPDKMPIAIYEKMDNFTTHEIQLEKGDQLFMFSDGYMDQFGGPKGKKFKYKQFKQLLSENRDKPMNDQMTVLDKTFEAWKGNVEQVDDIVVLGVKI